MDRPELYDFLNNLGSQESIRDDIQTQDVIDILEADDSEDIESDEDSWYSTDSDESSDDYYYE